MGGRQPGKPAAMSLCGNDPTGSAGHARGTAAWHDVAGELYAGRVTTGVVTVSGLKTEDLAPRPYLEIHASPVFLSTMTVIGGHGASLPAMGWNLKTAAPALSALCRLSTSLA